MAQRAEFCFRRKTLVKQLLSPRRERLGEAESGAEQSAGPFQQNQAFDQHGELAGHDQLVLVENVGHVRSALRRR